MVDSKIFLKRFMQKITRSNLRLRDFGMSIDLLMIWLLTQLRAMVDLYGPARTMMEMFSQTSLPRGTDL